jgi:cell wall-associated NlpC family hydrolase
MDCSGLVSKAFAEAGVSLPRSTREMWKVGKRVHYLNLRKGDLVFFRTRRERVSHVGILHDPEKKIFIHASSSRGVVLSSIEERYYKKRYIGARRVIL